MRFSATPVSKTPEPIVMKLHVRNYVQDPTSISEYGSDPIGLRGWSRRMREISLFVTFFFRFFTSPTGRHSGPIFTIYTSNDAFCAQGSVFWGSR